jgi:hypothetical protein
MKTKRLLALGLLAGGAAIGGTAQAASAFWDVNLGPLDGFGGRTGTAWALGDADSAWAAWNVFDSLNDTTPDAGSFGPAPQSVQELSGVAFLTGGGNIYSFSGATDFTAVLTTAGTTPGTRDVVLRLETLGTSVDLGSVLLNGIAPDVSDLVFSEPLGGFGGSGEERIFVWSDIGNTTTWQFDFNSVESSMSLDQIALYASPVTTVPAPAAVWLFGSAIASLGAWRRRRDLH